MPEANLQTISDSKLYQGIERHAAITNKWIGYVPLQTILGNEYKNLELRLTRFTMPAIQIGSTSIAIKGYSVDIPTHILNSETKEVTFEYIVDEDFENYASLYAWASGIGNYVDLGDEHNETAGEILKSVIPCRVWLLDSYKKYASERFPKPIFSS